MIEEYEVPDCCLDYEWQIITAEIPTEIYLSK